MWLWLLANAAEAREYHLDPAVTSISLDGMLSVGASEIDLTPKDFVVTMELRNASPSRLELTDVQCMRGKTVAPIEGERGHLIELLPGETRSLQLLCDHGRMATGDPSLRIAAVHANPDGGASATVFKNVVWRLREADIVAGRSDAGIQLATGAFDRPAVSREPVAVAATAPLAVPTEGMATEPAAVPVAAAAAAAEPVAVAPEPPVAAPPVAAPPVAAPPAAAPPAAAVVPAAPHAAAAPAPPRPPPPPPPAATVKPSPH